MNPWLLALLGGGIAFVAGSLFLRRRTIEVEDK
jgi:hypothetical protein